MPNSTPDPKVPPAPLRALRDFLKLESAGGVLLLMAAGLALILDNSPLAAHYEALLELPMGVTLGSLGLEKSLLHWINDGLMVVFFLLVGLEIKREVLEGELSSAAQIALPGLCAVGGMAAPALVYIFFNWHTPENLRGWAIPAATDIAFAVGVMALLGSRVPEGLKIFLLALAIIDDLGAIVIIAVFYTEHLSLPALGLAGLGIAGLVLLNRAGITRLSPYVLLGILVWICVLKSGVHATMSGVALAFAIPLRAKGAVISSAKGAAISSTEGAAISRAEGAAASPLHRCERALHPWVTYGVMPIFAFANAGVPLGHVTLGTLLHPLTLGIAGGLFFGKQLGVMAIAVLGRAFGLLRLPDNVSWAQMYGAAVLTGIGFTMSLFIGTLAFPGAESAAPLRLGVLAGSILSAGFGYAVLRLAPAKRDPIGR